MCPSSPSSVESSKRLRRSSRHGAAAVEFALTAPILFMLFMSAIELSRANMLVHTSSIAATEAARRGIIAGATATEVRDKALSELKAVGIVDAVVEVLPKDIVDETPQVTVNLHVPVSTRNGYSLARLLLGKEVFKSVTLQREGDFDATAAETPTRDGIQTSTWVETTPARPGNSSNTPAATNANSGNNNSAGGNSGNGNAGNGNSGNGNSGNGNSGNGNSGNGNSNSGGSNALRSLLRALFGN